MALASCLGRLATRPGQFEVSRQEVAFAGRPLDATYVRPAFPRTAGALIVFFTGDAGWLGASGEVFEHLAESGHFVAGYNSREALKPIKKSGEWVSTLDMAEQLEEVFSAARRDLGLPETTPVIVVGVSRGASAVAFAAVQPRLQQRLAGAIAIALTRESDYLRQDGSRDGDKPLEVDAQGRILLYPAVRKRAAIPLAVIQSAGDSYVPAAESRDLLGPDTATLRLYEVDARNHGFSGGRDALIDDLDDALAWIERSAAGTSRAGSP